MAKKRTYNKKQTGKKTAAKRNTKNQATRLDLAIVVLFVLSILSAVLIYGKSGVIGIKLNEILGGMMGIIKYVLPIGIFAIAIKIACADNEYLSSKLIEYAVLLISFSVLISVYQINIGELTILDKDLSNVVKDAYNLRCSRKRRRNTWSNFGYTTCQSTWKNRCYYIMYWSSNNVCSLYIWNKHV